MRKVLLSITCVLSLVGAAHAAEKISGKLPDTTYWAVDKPDDWNGTLILDLDGAGFPAPAAGARPAAPPPPAASPPAAAAAPAGNSFTSFRDWLLSQGYAVGGTQREPVGYQFDKAVDNLLAVRREFVSKWGEPKRTLASGASRGAFAARLAMERAPDVFAGALISAGGGGGEIAGLLDKLNAVFALKTLVDPASPLHLVNHTDVPADQKALVELVAKAKASPQGRARFALAAAFQQFAPWSQQSKPKPAPDDYEAQLDQIADSFAFGNPPSVRAGVEKTAGGNVSWNTGVDYASLLKRSGREPMVRALYKTAGLDLAADLDTLARAPRITADPAAVARYEKIGTYTGKIRGPVINVDNDDPIDPASYKLAYRQTLKFAGTEQLFRLIWADRAGHGNQTPLDRAVAFSLLIRRLDSGKWSDTSLPALRKLGAEIKRTAPSLGELSLFEPGKIPAPLSTWDASNWDSYRAPEVRLWPGKAPGTEQWTVKESVVRMPGGGGSAIMNVSDPTLTIHLPDPTRATGTGVIVAPGGGLRILGMEDRTTKFLLDRGIAVFVLKYRILQSDVPFGSGAGNANAPGPPRAGQPRSQVPEMEIRNANANPAPDDAKLTEVLQMATADAQQALRLVRKNAKEWGVDPNKLGMLGYSAGGGVAVGAALAPPGDAYPDFIISAFGPSLQDVTVPAHAPPLFMAVVENHFNVTNGLLALFAKWKEAGKPAELHVYDQGNVPLGIRAQGRPTETWIDRAYEWLQLHDFAAKPASWTPPPPKPT